MDIFVAIYMTMSSNWEDDESEIDEQDEEIASAGSVTDADESDGDVSAVEEDNEPEQDKSAVDAATRDFGEYYAADRPGFGPANANAVEQIHVIARDERCTSHIVSMYELTELISVRTAQIANGGPAVAMIEITPDMGDPRTIAIAEFRARKCPLKIIRYVGRSFDRDNVMTKNVEFWSPNEMTHPRFDD